MVASELPWLALVWYGLAFGLSQKAAPAIFRLIGLPRENWRRFAPGEELPPVLQGRAGWARHFLLRLFLCAYCTGFHAGWIGLLVIRFAPVLAYPLAGAAVCYALDTIFRRVEAGGR